MDHRGQPRSGMAERAENAPHPIERKIDQQDAASHRATMELMVMNLQGREFERGRGSRSKDTGSRGPRYEVPAE